MNTASELSNRASGPVFIVGAPRSGTTLLQYMLRSHPALSLPTGESHFIVPLMKVEKDFGDLSSAANVRRVLEAMRRQSREFLETDLHGLQFDIDQLAAEFVAEGRRSMRDLISGLFEKNAAGEGKVRWGDKTPYYVLHMRALLKWWPDAQFVHIIRDGRDVALSMFARRHDFKTYNTYLAARTWERYVGVGQSDGRAIGPEQYMELRYEDLLAEPRVVLQRICAFLGVDFVEAVLQHRKRGDGSSKTPLLGRPVKADNAGKWRTAMSAGQVRVFEGAAADTLRRCGYALATDSHRLPLLERGFFRWHNAVAARYYRMFPPAVAKADARTLQKD